MSNWKKVIKSAISAVKSKELVAIPKPVNTTELLKGKVALVVGGTGGIGQAIVKSFIRNGCQVIVAGTSEKKLESIVREYEEAANIRAVVVDLKNVGSLHESIETAAKQFGRIDILVNAAGVNVHKDFLDISEADFDAVMGINIKGAFFLSQAVADYMIHNKIKGHILNITSSSALRPAKTPYQISKWALRGFTLGLADRLLPDNIIVNAIAPGPVATSMLGINEGDSIYKAGQPSGRYAIPSEIADMAVMLASDMGDLVVGDTLYMTGGSGVISLHN